jgi:AcrR family transcriptional regulator
MMTPKQTNAVKELKREHLVSSAARVFAARGYRRATMDEIAQAAGTAKGTLYLYFEDKESLFYAVFKWLTAQTIERNSAVSRKDASTAERLWSMAEEVTRFMAEHREWFPLTLEVWAAGGSTDSRERFANALRDMYAQYRVVIADIIRAGQARGELRKNLEADALGAALTGTLDGLLLQCWFDPALDPLPLIKGFFDPLLCGMQSTNQGDKI